MERAAAELESQEPGYLPKRLFWLVCRLSVTTTTELAPIREENGRLQVLLTKRPDDDEFWPGEWHIPGVVIRATDEKGSLKNPIERILEDELEGMVPLRDTPKLAQIWFGQIARGAELDHVLYYPTDSNHETDTMKFFDVDDLPLNIMEHQREMVANIAALYRGELENPIMLELPIMPSTGKL